ncbi:MAG: hypothetical protein H6705_07570 [Myxococcales bacterium]|nr:hypothetical protein [Myxococcales bacterium]
MLVFGADSRLVRERDRERQAAAVGAARVLPGGHHLPLTAADALAAIVADALG